VEQTTVTLLRNQGSDTMGAPVAETQVHAPSLRVRVNKFADWIKTPHVMLSIILMLTLMYFVRRLGFDKVMDTDFTADLTIIEEGHELLKRIEEGGPLPLITSCSPGWIKFGEHFFPDLLEYVSTCKSPQQMFGALVKTYYARQAGIDPKDIFSVSLMPCTAKKFEAGRPEMASSGYQDVDVVLTSRELGRMIREAGIDFGNLPDEEHDAPMGISTGAAAIFGATGGVMEAALRTVYEVATGLDLPSIDFHEVRGLEGIKEAEVVLGDMKVRVGIAHGLANAKKILEMVRDKKREYHFIEIMALPRLSRDLSHIFLGLPAFLSLIYCSFSSRSEMSLPNSFWNFALSAPVPTETCLTMPDLSTRTSVGTALTP
jgi:iron-only hydrogenase group A